MSGQKSQKIPARKKPVILYLFCMFTLFPLFCTDGYFNIRHDRYYAFLVLSGAALLLVGLFRLLGGSDYKHLPQNLQAVQAAAEGPWYRRLSIGDWAMLLFVAAAAASTALSGSPIDALLGTVGRNNGLVLLVTYGGVYFMVTRGYVHRTFLFVGLSLCAAFVSLLALLNFFYLDPLHMFNRLDAHSTMIFISTIGNKNLLSGFLCMTLPVTVALFLYDRGKGLGVLCCLSTLLQSAALMCADSDSGFLGVGAFLAVFLILSIRRIGTFKKFTLTVTVMLLGAKLLNLFCSNPNKGMGGLQQFMVSSLWSTVLLAVAAALTAVLYLLHYKKPELRLTALSGVLTLALSAALLTLVAAFFYFSFIAPDKPMPEALTFLRLDDGWGTHRGFMWRRSMDIFNGFTWKEKLLGSGPDTFYTVFKPYFAELSKFGDTSTNAAHNEYINYLITQGLVGLGSYLVLVICALLKGLRRGKSEPTALIGVAAVIGYSVQALVNIAQPITTPLFIVFLSLCAVRVPKNPGTATEKK